MPIKNRKCNRLENYDYSQNGMYFVTICVKRREFLLGDIDEGGMRLSEVGKIAEQCWREIPLHFPDVRLDEFIIMPNHLHGIIGIIGNNNVGNDIVGNNNYCSLRDTEWQTKWSRSLSSVIRGFKIGVTKWCRENNLRFSWQKSYYDHIIRNEISLNKIREYIQINPKMWKRDKNNMENLLI
jgi:REP element-mobilizing transposase RayT